MYLLNNKKYINHIESQSDYIKKYLLDEKIHIFDNIEFLDNIEYKKNNIYIYIDENYNYNKEIINSPVYIIHDYLDIYKILSFYFSNEDVYDAYL